MIDSELEYIEIKVKDVKSLNTMLQRRFWDLLDFINSIEAAREKREFLEQLKNLRD